MRYKYKGDVHTEIISNGEGGTKSRPSDMKIPKEIQDLMPEKEDESDHSLCPSDSCAGCYAYGINQIHDQWTAVLPQMLALAEKRGAEGERERIIALFDRYSETYHWHKEKCMGHAHAIDCPSVLFRREALNPNNK